MTEGTNLLEESNLHTKITLGVIEKTLEISPQFNSGAWYLFGSTAIGNMFVADVDSFTRQQDGEAIFVGAGLRDGSKNSPFFFKYSLTFDRPADDFGSGSFLEVPMFPPYSDHFRAVGLDGFEIDTEGRFILFARMQSRFGERPVNTYVQRLTRRGGWDHTFGNESIQTLRKDTSQPVGSLFNDGRIVAAEGKFGEKVTVSFLTENRAERIDPEVLAPAEIEFGVVDVSVDSNQDTYILLNSLEPGETPNARIARIRSGQETLDEAFGDDGFVEVPFDLFSYWPLKIETAQERIYMLGRIVDGLTERCAVAVLHTSGEFDEEFSGDGRRIIHLSNGTQTFDVRHWTDIAIDDARNVFLIGHTQTEFVLAALDAKGEFLPFGNRFPQLPGVSVLGDFGAAADEEVTEAKFGRIGLSGDGRLIVAGSVTFRDK